MVMETEAASKLKTVLLAEDEPGLAMTLSDLLTGEGYDVKPVADGQKALVLASTAAFDVILLDVMLPGMNGFEVCRDLRRRGVGTPILMLTARGEVEDRVKGLNLGADDYLPKPFAIPELLARVQALLRRGSPAKGQRDAKTYQFDGIRVDFRSTTVTKNGKAVDVSAREFQLLCYLVEHRGATVSRRQLLKDVWGYDFAVLTRTVDVHFGLLRQKLEVNPKTPQYFITVRGLGYKFMGEPDR